MRFGTTHRDRSKRGQAASKVIFFVGKASDSDPPVNLMFGGWVGHLVEDYGMMDQSSRMGSRTDHLFDLWHEVAEADKVGSRAVPPEFARLAREVSAGDYLTLDTISRWAHGMVLDSVPPETAGPLKGVAEVLAVLPEDPYESRLIVGSPLYVERSAPSVSVTSGMAAEKGSEVKSSWVRRFFFSS
jgi:hypothetical protein